MEPARLSPKPVNRWRVALILILVLVFVAGYLVGMGHARSLVRQYLTLQADRDALRMDVELLRNELAVHKHGGEVERLASEQLRQELGQQQATIAELERSIAFYQEVVAPAKVRSGLALHAFDITRTDQSGVFGFRAVLVQPVDAERDTRGSIRVAVDGIQAGSRIVLEGESLTGSRKHASFSLRVLGEVNGQLRLPDSFVPEKVRITVEPDSRKDAFTEEMPWQAE